MVSIYTFTLRKNATFHDNIPVTADDVVFTISKTQDPALKSPVRANWNGVEVEKVDDRTVRFTLKISLRSVCTKLNTRYFAQTSVAKRECRRVPF
jgi:ABC-type transport system substrate-binding protein